MPEELLQGISTYQILYYVDTAFVFPYCVKLRYANSQIDEKDRETPRKGKRMACCVRCGGVPQYHIQLMEVRTYQNPLIYEQEPVQIMERTVEVDVCGDCARRQLRGDMYLLSSKELFQLSMVALMTALCLWVYRSGQNAAMLQGAVICFVLGVGCTLWEAQTRRKRYASMPEAEELEAAAAEVATAHVEQKSDGVEAIYIPITEDTIKLRSDDLMVDFDLQPEISEFIWHLIHKTHNTYKFLKK